MDAITVTQVTKKYGDIVALDGLSFQVKKGNVHGLLGPNGAGKTTILRAILGLIPVDKGQIEILGRPAKNINMNLLGYLPENGRPYEYLSGKDFLHLVGNLHDIPMSKLNYQINKYSEMFQLNELDALCGTYSKGTKRKLLIISALLHDADVLLLDEPFVDIDAVVRMKFKDFVRKHKSDGKTVLIATHILETAEQLCDEVSIIKRGKLLYTGTMREKTQEGGLERFFLETIQK